jgi:hypothetical protein
MRRFRSDTTNRFVAMLLAYLVLIAIVGWLESKDLGRLLKASAIVIPGFGTIAFIDYFFTYLEIDETKNRMTARSFFYSISRANIPSITCITKEPHPIFKGASWAIFIRHKNDRCKEKTIEIWPSFSPETIGKFLTDLKALNPSIQFDKECEKWMEKARNIKA